MESNARARGSDDGSGLRQALVEELKGKRATHSERVEEAFRAVPRHLFLPGVPPERVYSDEAIPTKRLDGEVVSSSSQPAIMAIMLEQLGLKPGHRVIEIGAGTGYNAALIAHIVGETGQVVTIDIDEDIIEAAREHLEAAGLARVRAVCGDGALGYPEGAPYDRIILTVGAWDIAPAWREQLKPGGRLVLPLVIRGNVQACVAFESAGDHLRSVSVCGCGFMMLRGALAGPGDVQLGPIPGLSIAAEKPELIDADRIYDWLTGPSRDWHTGVASWAPDPWLAVHESGFCSLSARGEAAEAGLLPCLGGYGGEWRMCFTSGLLGEDGVCLLMRPPGESPCLDDLASSPPSELYVRSFGWGETLAHQLIGQIRAWEQAGRPSVERLSIKVYPHDVGSAPSPGETVLHKRWTQVVFAWQQAE